MDERANDFLTAGEEAVFFSSSYLPADGAITERSVEGGESALLLQMDFK